MEQLSSKLATLYEEEFLKKKSIEGDEFDFVMQVWVPEVSESCGTKILSVVSCRISFVFVLSRRFALPSS